MNSGVTYNRDGSKKPGVAEGKKPEHNLGTGWMLAKDKELGKKVAQNTGKARREKELMQKYAGKKDVKESDVRDRLDRMRQDTQNRLAGMRSQTRQSSAVAAQPTSAPATGSRYNVGDKVEFGIFGKPSGYRQGIITDVNVNRGIITVKDDGGKEHKLSTAMKSLYLKVLGAKQESRVSETQLSEADNAAVVRAFKKIDGGAEPSSPLEWAISAALGGAPKGTESYELEKSYNVPRAVTKEVQYILQGLPSIDNIEKMISDRDQQSTQQSQSQEISALQHKLSIQQLITQSELDQADANAIKDLDIEARQAIKERMQEMALAAKERLAQIEIDIRNSKESEAERQQALEMAKMNNSHEIAVIEITAAGEYKKAKLEADYQIKIKELEVIDNQQERQNRLDVINAEKEKEISIINTETANKIKEIQADVDADQQRSDMRVREEFMSEFKPIWSSMVEKASQTGNSLSQNISAVKGALGRLGKPVMPKAEGVAEARQSAAVKLAKAWDKQKAKSAASRERAKELLNPAKKDQEKKNG
jgi:hypothetical protein